MFWSINFHFSQNLPLLSFLSPPSLSPSLTLQLSFHASDQICTSAASGRRSRRWELIATKISTTTNSRQQRPTLQSNNLTAPITLPWRISTLDIAILSGSIAQPSYHQSCTRGFRLTRSEPSNLISCSISDCLIRSKRTPSLLFVLVPPRCYLCNHFLHRDELTLLQSQNPVWEEQRKREKMSWFFFFKGKSVI